MSREEKGIISKAAGGPECNILGFRSATVSSGHWAKLSPVDSGCRK